MVFRWLQFDKRTVSVGSHFRVIRGYAEEWEGGSARVMFESWYSTTPVSGLEWRA